MPGTSDRRYKPGPDQAVDSAARKAEEFLDFPHPELLHGYFFAAFFAGAFAG